MALVTDFYFEDTARVGDSMAIVAAVSWVVGVVLLGMGTRHYRASVEAARAWDDEFTDQGVADGGR